MKSIVKSEFVANGGWPEKDSARPIQFGRFGILSLLWIFPSLGALWIIGSGYGDWFVAGSILEGIKRIKFEEWVGIGLLAAHALWITLAIRREGALRAVLESLPGGHMDPRKLY